MSDAWSDARFLLGVEWRALKYHPREWLLLSGNRLVLSCVFLLAVLTLLYGAALEGLVPFRRQTPVLYLLFALISGNFTLITIVVSLSQFILTRHLESPGEVRDRVNDMLAYRQEVGESTHRSALPVTPSQFFETLFLTLRHDVRRLEREDPMSALDDEEVQRGLDELTRGLDHHASYVLDILDRSEVALVFVLFSTLSADYERYLYIAWYLQSEHADDLSAQSVEILDRLVETLRQVDVARRIFKTAFIQSELASLSRRLLYIGLPVLVATLVLMLMFTTPTPVPISQGFLSIVIPLVVTIGLAPIVLLAAYILRLATVARRTASMYPFTTPFDR